MGEPQIKIEMGKYKPKWYVNFADFANMVKAFIGSNYLSVAYAFRQSGLALGLCGMALISGLTAHCCMLIVKTKHHIIRKHLENMKINGKIKNGKPRNGYSSIRGNTPTDSGVDDESLAEEISPFMERSVADDAGNDTDSEASLQEMEEHMMVHLSYGEVGKRCFGGIGLGMVNFFIALTQFGFCVGYFIFIGNTVQSLFPMELCYTNSMNVTRCHLYYDLDHDTTLLNTSQEINNLHEMLPHYDSYIAEPNSSTLEPSNFSTTTPPENITTTLSPNTTTAVAMAIIEEIRRSKPNLMLLVAAPLPIFIIFAFIKSVRALGIISVFANCCILGGCLALFVFLINEFEVHGTLELAKLKTFPVFFGMVTAAFEGIGLVIPIESSMVGNRRLFPMFLYGALGVLTFILGGFGVLGYLRFGEDVDQMLNKNMAAGEIQSDIVNIGICFGILFTFPLQIYPVIEILEKYLFSEGRICGPPKRDDKKKLMAADDGGDEEEQLLSDDDKDPLLSDDEVVTLIPDSVPKWKRGVLRIVVVMIAGGLAVLLKDNFAYVGAFVGAVGSSVLAFILPCLFHLKVCWSDINFFLKAKDMFIVCFGVVASVISVVSVIERIAKNSLSH